MPAIPLIVMGASAYGAYVGGAALLVGGAAGWGALAAGASVLGGAMVVVGGIKKANGDWDADEWTRAGGFLSLAGGLGGMATDGYGVANSASTTTTQTAQAQVAPQASAQPAVAPAPAAPAQPAPFGEPAPVNLANSAPVAPAAPAPAAPVAVGDTQGLLNTTAMETTKVGAGPMATAPNVPVAGMREMTNTEMFNAMQKAQSENMMMTAGMTVGGGVLQGYYAGEAAEAQNKQRRDELAEVKRKFDSTQYAKVK